MTEKFETEKPKNTHPIITFMRGGFGTFVPQRAIRFTRKVLKGNWNHAAVISQLLFLEENPYISWEYRTIEGLSKDLEIPYDTISKIIRKLKKSGIVIAEAKGKYTVLRLNLEKLEEAIKTFMPEEFEDLIRQNGAYQPDTQSEVYDIRQFGAYCTPLIRQFGVYATSLIRQIGVYDPAQTVDTQRIATRIDYNIINETIIRGDFNIGAPFEFFEKFFETFKTGKPVNLVFQFNQFNPFNQLNQLIQKTPNPKGPVCKENKKVKTEIENYPAPAYLSDQPVSQPQPVNLVAPVNPVKTVNPASTVDPLPDYDYIFNPLNPTPAFTIERWDTLPKVLEKVRKLKGGEQFINELKAIGWDETVSTYENLEIFKEFHSRFRSFESSARALSEFRKLEPNYKLTYPLSYAEIDTFTREVFRVLSYRELRETLCSELNLPLRLEDNDNSTQSDIKNVLVMLEADTKLRMYTIWMIREYAKRFPEDKCKDLKDKEFWMRFKLWLNAWLYKVEQGIDFDHFKDVIEVTEYCISQSLPEKAAKKVLLAWYDYVRPKGIERGFVEKFAENYWFNSQRVASEKFFSLRKQSTPYPSKLKE
jgi:DNA-binding transcriptional ArsR family regulator